MINIFSHYDESLKDWVGLHEASNFWSAIENNNSWKTKQFITNLHRINLASHEKNINIVNYTESSENGYYLIFNGKSHEIEEHHGFAFLTREIIEKVNQGKLKLLVVFVHETFDSKTSFREWYWKFCGILSRVGITRPNSVVIFTSTDTVGFHSGEERCVYAYYPWFEAQFQSEVKLAYRGLPTIDLAKKDRFYINLNLRPRPHRFLLVMYLYFRQIIDQGYVSWFNPKFKNWNEILSDHGYEKWGYGLKGQLTRSEHASGFFYFMTHFRSLPELRIDEPVNDEANGNNTWTGTEEYYQRSRIELINETHYELYGDNFLTEKSFKSIFHGLPFIINGPRGHLKLLQREGYQTFPELFDESYDSAPCDVHKIMNIGEMVNHLVITEDGVSRVNTPEVQEKVRFNQQLFWNKNHSRAIADLLENCWNK